MAGKLNRFQTKEFMGWNSHVTKENHISAVYGKAPQKAVDFVVSLQAWKKGKTLDTYLSKFPTKTFETDDEYTWDVVASTQRNIELVEARTVNNASLTNETVLGANGEPFYLVFGEAWFNDGEVLVGELNEVYQMRILGDPRFEGTHAVYKVEMMGGNTTGIPVEEVQPGKRFSYEYAPVERELSRKVGGTRMASPISMRNEFSVIRKYKKVSGALLNKKMAMGLPVIKETNGRYVKDSVTVWMNYEEYVFNEEWANEKNRIMAYGRSNRNQNGEYMNIGKSGEVIREGAGLFEQMEVANTSYYNTFSIKLLENALYELSAATLDFKDRTFVIRTGEMGAIQFHKAVRQEVNGWTMFTYDAGNLGVVKKTSAAYTGGTQALAAGYQFTEYYAPNGVHVKLEVDPFYDDPVRNKIQHPNGGPAYSYRYDIFDIGSMEHPNIFKVGIKNQPELWGYEWGLRNPWTGQMGNPHMSFDEDSAAFHKMWWGGVCVLDPLRTMSLIPNILQG